MDMESSHLDSQADVEAVDRSRMHKVLRSFPYQLEKGWELGSRSEKHFDKPPTILILGMGGSAIGGDLLSTIVRENGRGQVIVNRSYDLPTFERDTIAVLAVSYSGNTEETISTAEKAHERALPMITISSGGKLQELSSKWGIQHIKIPSGYQPRAALGLMLGTIMHLADIWGNCAVAGKIMDAIQDVRNTVLSVSLETPLANNKAKRIAVSLGTRTPIIVTSADISSVAERMKTQFNENAKRLAWTVIMPEGNHNDWIPLMVDDRLKDYVGLSIARKSGNTLLERRMKIVYEKLSSRMRVETIDWPDMPFISSLLSTVIVGDYISYYTALLSDIDPTPVEPIEEFKRLLAAKGGR
ncbi:MAG: bifunctional phosphoglucose/phosphomannose isomerase [Methanomassiliicoccales archaeon]